LLLKAPDEATRPAREAAAKEGLISFGHQVLERSGNLLALIKQKEEQQQAESRKTVEALMLLLFLVGVGALLLYLSKP
jgi:hypothetical protein